MCGGTGVSAGHRRSRREIGQDLFAMSQVHLRVTAQHGGATVGESHAHILYTTADEIHPSLDGDRTNDVQGTLPELFGLS